MNRRSEKVLRDVQRAGVQLGTAAGGGTIFTEPVLVVNQKAKFIEINQQYAMFDANGQQIAARRQVGQSKAKKVLRLVTQRRPVHDSQARDHRHGGRVLLRSPGRRR